MKTVFILFQTDQWKTASSKVLFGVFSTFSLANQAAKDNDLYRHESCVIIEETEINQFQ